MIAAQLMSFAEVAQELGIATGEVRRLVIDEGAITAQFVYANGDHCTADSRVLAEVLQGRPVLDPLFAGDASGVDLLQVDEDGAIHQIDAYFEGSQIVGIKGYIRTGDHLRIARTELEAFLARQLAAQASRPTATLTATQVPKPKRSLLPRGLTPAELASAFANIKRTESEWLKYLSAGNVQWLQATNVLMEFGRDGSTADRKKVPHRRNPVEIAKHLIDDQPMLISRFAKAFQSAPGLRDWHRVWEAYIQAK
jgi:hypothetical protein